MCIKWSPTSIHTCADSPESLFLVTHLLAQIVAETVDHFDDDRAGAFLEERVGASAAK